MSDTPTAPGILDLDALLMEQLEDRGPTIQLGGREWSLPVASARTMLVCKEFAAAAVELEKINREDPDRVLTQEEQDRYRRLVSAFNLPGYLRELAGDELYGWIQDNLPAHALGPIFWALIAAHEGQGIQGNPRRGRKAPQDRKPKGTGAKSTSRSRASAGTTSRAASGSRSKRTSTASTA